MRCTQPPNPAPMMTTRDDIVFVFVFVSDATVVTWYTPGCREDGKGGWGKGKIEETYTGMQGKK